MPRVPRSILSILALAALTTTVFSLGACGNSEGPAKGERAPVTVFAAASTTDVLQALAGEFTAETGGEVRFSFASSSTLSRQIEAGAPADVYISADPKWMDQLEEQALIRSETRRNLLGNELVLIAPRGRGFSVTMASDFPFAEALKGRLALGDPAHVPAGRYAREALQSLGWWDTLQDQLIPALDVRDALRIVALGEAEAGVVYSTDAASSEHVEVIGVFPADSHTPIHYPVALCREASAEAGAFVEFLFSSTASEIFESAGFTVAPNAEP